MIVIGSRRRTQPPPPHVIVEALLDPDRDPRRPWLTLLHGEHRPEFMRATGPTRVEWSSLWIELAPPNEYGVLAHDVTLPNGETVYNPMRVIPNCQACEVVCTLGARRRQR